MTDFYALTSKPLPKSLYRADGECSIRILRERERLAIEDFFFSKEINVAVDRGTTAVVVSESLIPKIKLREFGILIEFGLALISASGFPSVTMTATFDSAHCTEALIRSEAPVLEPVTFSKKMKKAAANAWMRRLFAALRNTKDHMHITADRFVRYCRTTGSRDSLLDLCIALESLLESQTEISFRFGACLTKVTGEGGTGAEGVSDLLSDLYDLRSKIVHGADAAKQHQKLDPHSLVLRQVARKILTTYVLYMSDHNRDQWKQHLKSSLFK
jgi:hypothetical protein